MKRTFLDEFELDRARQKIRTSIARDFESERRAKSQCHCKGLIGNEWRQIRNVQKRLVQIRVRLWTVNGLKRIFGGHDSVNLDRDLSW